MGLDQQAAHSFWETYLGGASCSAFPVLPTMVYEPHADVTASHLIPWSGMKHAGITTSTAIQAAWGIVTAQYTASADVVFGATLAGRNAPVDDIGQMAGPTITTVPIHVSFQPEELVADFLQRLQDQSTEMIPYEQTGLQNICQVSSTVEQACSFSSLLLVQPAAVAKGADSIFSQHFSEEDDLAFNSYTLLLECELGNDQVAVTASYDCSVIDALQMQQILSHFEHVLYQLSQSESGSKLADVMTISKRDQQEIQVWNAESPEAVQSCVHELVQEQVHRQPNAPAVCVWDSNLTYQELDNLSSRLAGRLVVLGVGPEAMVPICFEKSKWAVVAMLGILKAGGAFVPLDPAQPLTRLEAMCSAARARLVLSSHLHSRKHLGPFELLVVDQPSLVALPPYHSVHIEPGSPAYTIFTSGSTGSPKGVVVSHTSFATSAFHHARAMMMGPQVRVLQFSSFSFDASLCEILSTLLFGGCVCVPSEMQKMDDIQLAIRTLKANYALLTPSVSRFLDPALVPSLRHLVLMGEKPSLADMRQWSHLNFLIVGYGPTECSVCCAVANMTVQELPTGNIGKAVGCTSWVADASDYQRLVPIGAEGELLIEGPILARGYLNDPQKTNASFIENPRWAELTSAHQCHRFYKTGDIVRYNSDGSLTFIGRKDTQVKLHGQRIELSEIEHQLRRCLPQRDVAVEVVSLHQDAVNKALVAYVGFGNELEDSKAATNSFMVPVTAISSTTQQQIASILAAAKTSLSQELPSYMVPSTFVPVRQLPLTVSGKTDRRQLRALVEEFSAEQLAALALDEVVKLAPSSRAEKQMQALWAQVLKVEKDAIGANDSFFRLGGDSMAAMRLVSAARTAGVSLTVADVFRQPFLSEMSMVFTSYIASSNTAFENSSPALESTLDCNQSGLHGSILKAYPSLAIYEVDKILECTDFQSFAVCHGQLRSRGFTNYFIFDFDTPIEADRLQASCHALITQHQILRTVFAAHDLKLMQVILRRFPFYYSVHQCEKQMLKRFCEELVETDKSTAVAVGDLITEFFAISCGHGPSRLIIRLSHAQYDGISISRMLADFRKVVRCQNLSNPFPFRTFIDVRRTLNASAAKKYWRKLLQGSCMTNFCLN